MTILSDTISSGNSLKFEATLQQPKQQKSISGGLVQDACSISLFNQQLSFSQCFFCPSKSGLQSIYCMTIITRGLII